MLGYAALAPGSGSGLFIYNPATGEIIKSIHNPSGGYDNISSQFLPGQDSYLGDLNGDGLTDALFVNQATGLATSAINTPAGFDTSQNVALPLASLIVLVDSNPHYS